MKNVRVQPFNILKAYEMHYTISTPTNIQHLDLGAICFPVPYHQAEAEKSDELIRFRGKIKAESTLISISYLFHSLFFKTIFV